MERLSDSEAQYRSAFGIDPFSKEKVSAALEHALDIRKFEISLYWQRAAYFWALIAVAFAGYFAILGADSLEDKNYLGFIVANVGILFTWAWFLVNRGSKYWQENWENHVDMLEDQITGPLYKTILHRPNDDNLTELLVTGPLPVSVSKINQWVSAFTLVIWIFLIVHASPPFCLDAPLSMRHVLVVISTVASALLMIARGRTYLTEYDHKMISRDVSISD